MSKKIVSKSAKAKKLANRCCMICGKYVDVYDEITYEYVESKRSKYVIHCECIKNELIKED